MKKSLLISLELNFTPNTLGCYELTDAGFSVKEKQYFVTISTKIFLASEIISLGLPQLSKKLNAFKFDKVKKSGNTDRQ